MPVPTEENKAIFRLYVEELGNEGKLELADEIFDSYLAYQSDGSVLERSPKDDVKRFMGEFRGITPMDKEVDVTGIGIFRFSDGKVVES